MSKKKFEGDPQKDILTELDNIRIGLRLIRRVILIDLKGFDDRLCQVSLKLTKKLDYGPGEIQP